MDAIECVPNDHVLDSWIEKKQNVLFRGRHGVGKTAIILEAFNRNKLKHRYFSASTMDPWVDFIGVPRQMNDEQGPYLDLVRPKDFRDDQIEAIFMDELNRCLTGDTVIPLADGTYFPIKDLVGKEYFYVYSYDVVKNRVVLAKGHSARKTATNAKIMKITIDNGTSVKCTGNHPFLLSNGTFKRADQLCVNDSLMPLYRLFESNKKNMEGYEYVWQPKKNSKWEPTYYLADRYNVENGTYIPVKGEHRHHIDMNKNNNSPENITRLSVKEHMRLHGTSFEFTSKAGKLSHKKNPDLAGRTILTPSSKKKAQANSAHTRRTSASFKHKRSIISKEMYTPEMRSRRKNITEEQWESGQFDSIDRSAALKKNHITRTFNLLLSRKVDGNVLTASLYDSFRPTFSSQGSALLTLKKIDEFLGSFDTFCQKYIEYVSLKVNNNHKVIAIEEAGHEDVYDITVDCYHNFALQNGIFVHNSSKKVRNSIMELIQFKSINGKVFKNLKIIWAAVNPDDEDDTTYDVEKLDPAQQDRFQIQVSLPYEPFAPFFKDKFGEETAQRAIDWWKALDVNMKKLVSPRRLEYALMYRAEGGDPRYVLPPKAGISALVNMLDNGSPRRNLKELIASNKKDETKVFLENENNFEAVKELFSKTDAVRKFCLPLLNQEKFSMLLASSVSVKSEIFSNIPQYRNTLDNIIAGSANRKIKREVQEVVTTWDKNNVKGKVSSFSLGGDHQRLVTYTKEDALGIAELNEIGSWGMMNSALSLTTPLFMEEAENAVVFLQSFLSELYEYKEFERFPWTLTSKVEIISKLILLASDTEAQMTKDRSLLILAVTEYLCSRTQVPTLGNHPDLKTIGRVVVYLHNSHGLFSTPVNFADSYPKIFAKLVYGTELLDLLFDKNP